MIKNQLIIIPIENAWDHSADFLRQTVLTLSKNNLVYIYDQNNHYFFLRKNKKCVYPKHKNIYFHQVKYFIPFERVPLLDKINRYLSFKLFLKKYHKKNKILWIFYPNYFDLAQLKDKKTINLYDCVDYQEDKEKEKLLINNVDYFFVNSLSLKKLHKKQNKKPIYINRQGFFEPNDKEIKTVILKQKKPVIGYIGGINYRLDYLLIDKLIKNHPEWQFVLYGPEQKNKEKDMIYKTTKWLKKIKKYKNVNFGNNSDRNYVYGLIRNFDVAIIPYNVNIPFNKYCYPMKVFEYLYLGKPVVSSPILELKLKKFNNYIKTAETYQSWEKMINLFLKDNLSEQQKTKQKQLAKNNSWNNKIINIEKWI